MTKKEKSRAYYLAHRDTILAKQHEYTARLRAIREANATTGRAVPRSPKKRNAKQLAWQRGYMKGRAFGKHNGNGVVPQAAWPELVALIARVRAETRTEVRKELLASLESQ